jgi:hypothetical protein
MAVDEVQLALDGAFRTIFVIVAVLGAILLATEAAVRFSPRGLDPVIRIVGVLAMGGALLLLL